MIRSFESFMNRVAAEEAAHNEAIEKARNEFIDSVNKFANEAEIGYAIVEDFLADYEEIVSSYLEYLVNGVAFTKKNDLVSEVYRRGIEEKIPPESSSAFRTYFIELRNALEEYGVPEFVQWYLDDTWVYDEDGEFVSPEYPDLFQALLIMYKEIWLETKRLAAEGCAV